MLHERWNKSRRDISGKNIRQKIPILLDHKEPALLSRANCQIRLTRKKGKIWNILSQPQEIFCPKTKNLETKFLLFQYQSWHPVLCLMAFLFLLFLCCPLSVFHPLVFNLAPRVCLILSPRGKRRTLIENSHLMSASCLCLLLGKVVSERFQHTKAARTAQTPHTHKAESL